MHAIVNKACRFSGTGSRKLTITENPSCMHPARRHLQDLQCCALFILADIPSISLTADRCLALLCILLQYPQQDLQGCRHRQRLARHDRKEMDQGEGADHTAPSTEISSSVMRSIETDLRSNNPFKIFCAHCCKPSVRRKLKVP